MQSMRAGFSFSYPPISLLLGQPLSIKKSYAGAIQLYSIYAAKHFLIKLRIYSISILCDCFLISSDSYQCTVWLKLKTNFRFATKEKQIFGMNIPVWICININNKKTLIIILRSLVRLLKKVSRSLVFRQI